MTSVTNMNAGVIDSNRFAPYGEPIDPVAKNSRRSNSTYGFTGEAHGIEEGLVYLRARYYEPNTMRFLSQDTMFGDIQNPLTRNLYIYGNANPMTYADPSGHFAFIPYLIKAGAHAAADLMLQTTMNYLFNPTTQFNFKASLGAVNWWQVGRSAIEGLISAKKGYIFAKAAFTAIGDVIVNAAHNRGSYTEKQALLDFTVGFFGSLTVDGTGQLIKKYGAQPIKKGLKWLGASDETINKIINKWDLDTKSNVADSAYDGVRIINKKYAGQVFELSGDLAKKYPKGVKFTLKGFPDFSPYAKIKISVSGLTGEASDFAKANKAVGLKSTPTGYTWHHVEDGLTMMLIPRDLHEAVRHTGGAALLKKGLVP
jgi:RHS repeat-associated protein